MTAETDGTLNGLLDKVENAAVGSVVSVRDVINEFGDRAVTPLILTIAVLLISPLSGIPGVPTASAFIVVTLAIQALFGQRRLWLPEFLLRREVKSKFALTAIDWLRKPCAFADRLAKPRLTWLTTGAMRWVTLSVCVIVPMFWPLLEFLPLMTTFGATIVALLAFGLFTRDGIYVLIGYAIVVASIIAVRMAIF